MTYEHYGSLNLKAYTGGGAIPVKGAVIRISGADENNSDVVYSLLTDLDGIIPTVKLPSPDAALSKSEGAELQPYSNYDVEVTKDGFYPKHVYNLPIFENVTTLLDINMIPKDSRQNDITYPKNTLETYIFENERLE